MIQRFLSEIFDREIPEATGKERSNEAGQQL
ncbi:hypothetical protein SAMN05444271_1204 [Halohasta litchfieldiae]|jgi:hypothetical protein|uniref:Uncharacterized protein n=1 Tax=Halohasta litchfieldiae TaxID=1073996 RepID=A0A1H6W7A8_9EURY|nr:hypothetical protein SAMN05444271_1204 [Halohasta litchfieldiae]